MPAVTVDQKARQEAIDPSQSVIVQAPAGSGKTELLTQRFLQLLSCAEKNPEEIIAITFTRKAAAEMRQRIISALNDASNDIPPEAPHKKITWNLAKNALKKDRTLHWSLSENPNRLRILTIDALSMHLVKQMPVSAEISPQLNVTDNPFLYYREAAEQVLLTTPMETLLLHLDNRVYLLESLLVEILSKREQWLPHITGYKNNTYELRSHMEQALQNVVLECLQTVKASFTQDILSELIPLADFAGHYCKEHDTENPIANCCGLTTFSNELDAFPTWLGIANLLLTQKGEWRKSITKRQGFLAKSELKPQMIEFLAALSTNITLKEHLHAVMLCPPIHYDDQQWHIIDTLISILPILAAQLNLIFSRDNVTDFVELNLAALRALGEDENPTNLALQLDYRINHLLIDEFQDTSVIQFQLIEKLITGWENNDGRTLFLVGDPMQSIYRFRNAEVGLFLQAQQKGIGALNLIPLTLKQNFRSHLSIVDWNNHSFKTIFPKKADISSGATPYETAFSNNQNAGIVQWHPSINDDGTDEAKQLTHQIKILQKNTPDDTIAVLARSRTHLHIITQRLHEANIPFQAIDLEPLVQCTEIQDIHSLTRALLHREDRIAWLSVLRAPYCGLLLADLTYIAEHSKNITVLTLLKSQKTLDRLSDDARLRLSHCLPPLFNAINHIGRTELSNLLRNLWTQLDGPKILETPQQQMNIERYLKRIMQLESENKPFSLTEIDEQLNTLYAEPNPKADSRLQIMTIHKAKGLEFDHVLLPGLHRKSPNDKHQILKWLERPNYLGSTDLILAPIKATEQKNDLIYSYLNRVEKLKSDHEYARLLYVAATRARKSLHLFANAIFDENNLKAPVKGSFLNLLWQTAESYFLSTNKNTLPANTVSTSKKLRRFTKDYLETKTAPIFENTNVSQVPNITLTHLTPHHIGTVIHEALECIAKTGQSNKSQWPLRLKQLGLSETEIDTALHTIQQAIVTTQKDPRGQWILSNQHEDAHCELQLSFLEDKQTKNIIIDRCFIDNGTRWIIDYKTGTPNEEELDHYQKQLERYANVFRKKERIPIRTALYFPITSNWIEFKIEEAVSA